MQLFPGIGVQSQAPPACVLIADDLTGACDSGVEFAQRGLITRVGPGRRPSGPCDVVAVSTDSRSLTPTASATLIRTVARDLPLASATLVFKKIDSTLRGPVVAECDALLETTGAPFGVIAPALPSQGRTVKNGLLEVCDINRGWSLNIPEILRKMGAVAAPLDPGQAGSVKALAAWMLHLAETSRYLLCDAVSDDDLAMVARALLACGNRPLWIGSAGLARQAAALLSPAGKSSPPPLLHPVQAPVVLCVGSHHPVTDLQVHEVCRNYEPAMLDANATTEREVHLAVSSGRHLILRIDTNAPDLIHLPKLLQAVRRSVPASLVMTGGETAALVCRAAGVDQLLLEGELVAGVATGYIEGGSLHGLRFATKSGGFGTESCLVDAIHILCGAATGEKR